MAKITGKLQEAEARQLKAAGEEDFETAHEVGEEIVGLQAKLGEAARELERAGGTPATLMATLKDAVAAVPKAEVMWLM